MAINFNTAYPTKTDSPGPTYPYGKARNIVTPGDGTGTPLEKAWVNDIWGMLQNLLVSSGQTPSGSPDTATYSQYVTAIRSLAGGMQSVGDIVALGAKKGGLLYYAAGRNTYGDGGEAMWVAGAGGANGMDIVSMGGGYAIQYIPHPDGIHAVSLGLSPSASAASNGAVLNRALDLAVSYGCRRVIVPDGKTYKIKDVVIPQLAVLSGGTFDCSEATGSTYAIEVRGLKSGIENCTLMSSTVGVGNGLYLQSGDLRTVKNVTFSHLDVGMYFSDSWLQNGVYSDLKFVGSKMRGNGADLSYSHFNRIDCPATLQAFPTPPTVTGCSGQVPYYGNMDKGFATKRFTGTTPGSTANIEVITGILRSKFRSFTLDVDGPGSGYQYPMSQLAVYPIIDNKFNFHVTDSDLYSRTYRLTITYEPYP